MEKVGVEVNPIEIPYEVFTFSYVSPGGNSSQETKIIMNRESIDALIEYIGSKVSLRESVYGQRLLMTTKLRSQIKERDNHTCQNKKCGISIKAEPHLLLEVDHIIPLSKGGKSTPGNLQTLCWRCNRSKGSKIVS